MTFDAKAPPSLLKLDRFFSKLLTRPLRKTGAFDLPVYPQKIGQVIEKKISPSEHLTSAQKMALYNQQFWFRMFVVLQRDYPVLLRLFGYFDFNYSIAEPFIQSHFPNFWALATLGFSLPLWVEEEYTDEDKALVHGASLLDQVHNRLVYAIPQLPLQPSDLTSLESSTLFLQPTVRPLDLKGDFVSFRAELLKQEPVYWEEHDFPSIDWTSRSLVFFLLDDCVVHEEISIAESKLLRAFQKGTSLAQALAGLTNEPVGDWFKKWTQRGWIYRGGRS